MLQISDPLIKIIPPYRHRAESSCSSGSGGGGGVVQRAVTPKLGIGNTCSGDNSSQTSSTSSPHFNTSVSNFIKSDWRFSENSDTIENFRNSFIHLKDLISSK